MKARRFALLWSEPALADLASIRAYIAANDPTAARRIARSLVEAIDRLETLPGRGRPGRVAGTRELVLAKWPWIVVYESTATEVAILRVLHAARNRRQL